MVKLLVKAGLAFAFIGGIPGVFVLIVYHAQLLDWLQQAGNTPISSIGELQVSRNL